MSSRSGAPRTCTQQHHQASYETNHGSRSQVFTETVVQKCLFCCIKVVTSQRIHQTSLMSGYYEDMPPKHSAPPRSPAKMMMQYSSSWLGPFLNGYREQKIQRHGHFDGFNMDLIVLKTGLMVIVDCWVLINGSRIAYLNDQDLSLLTRLLSPLVPPVDRWASNGQLFMFYMNQGLNSLYQKREDWLCYKATKKSLK